MAMSNADRQAKWLEKNRALHNLRRRNARKKLSSGEKSLGESGGIKTLVKTEIESEFESQGPSSARDAAHLFETKKVGEFRMLVIPPKEVGDEPEMPVVKPKVFFNDHGAQISERVWNDLQEKKRVALESGYEFDPQ